MADLPLLEGPLWSPTLANLGSGFAQIERSLAREILSAYRVNRRPQSAALDIRLFSTMSQACRPLGQLRAV